MRGGRLAVLRYAAALWRRPIAASAGVTIVSARALRIAGADGAPVQADGDIVTALPVTLELAVQPIPLLQP